jgi:AGCS family alanine or glycine:cation symporter
VITGAWSAIDPATGEGLRLNGAPLTSHAFKTGLSFLGGYGGYIVTAAVLLFGVSTMISWSYYGDRSIQYLIGDKAILPYRLLFCVMIFVGAVNRLEAVWTFGDIGLGVMTIPNLIAIIALSGAIVKLTKEYYAKDHKAFK